MPRTPRRGCGAAWSTPPPPTHACPLASALAAAGPKKPRAHGGPVPTSSRMPTYAPQAVADGRRPHPLACLLRAALLLLIGLCAVVHGPTGDPRQSAPAVTAASAPVASDGAPPARTATTGTRSVPTKPSVRPTTLLSSHLPAPERQRSSASARRWDSREHTAVPTGSAQDIRAGPHSPAPPAGASRPLARSRSRTGCRATAPQPRTACGRSAR